jgi:hypothetical protein
MPDEMGRFNAVAKFARTALVATVIFLAIAAAATVAVAVLKLLDPAEGTNATQWLLALVVEMIAMLWAFVLYGVVGVLVASEAGIALIAGRMGRVETIVEDVGRSLKELAEVAPLSDNAKSLIYRDRELEALREAIHGDIIRQEYAPARKLVEVIESRFGQADEAAKLREDIEKSRAATLEEKVDLAVQGIEDLCRARQWARALRESQRIMRLFANNPKAGALPDRIKAARSEHKRELLQAYGEAVRKNDVDAGVEMLKQLDGYLTPQEAAALEESARGVFRARLQNLGVQFSICVADQRWTDAITAGNAISSEFPNSRFAQEVREKMGQLQRYAESAAKRKERKTQQADDK